MQLRKLWVSIGSRALAGHSGPEVARNDHMQLIPSEAACADLLHNILCRILQSGEGQCSFMEAQVDA